MGKTEFTASANVRVTVEVQGLGPYGADWTAEKIHAQVERGAVEELKRLIQNAPCFFVRRAVQPPGVEPGICDGTNRPQ